MAVLETIAPIFLIILFGYLIETRGYLKGEFLSQANRFIFLFSLPFLIFSGIARSSLEDVSSSLILSVIVPTVVMSGISLVLGLAGGLREGRLGSFIQTTFHGNVTYIGLAVLLYMIGEDGLKRGSILIGFLILVNNALAIAVLSWTSRREGTIFKPFIQIARNPVIIATFLGMFVLYFRIPVPVVMLRSASLLGNIALPLALIIIGASISPGAIRKTFSTSLVIAVMKLAVLPYLCVIFCKMAGIPLKDALPGVILLATPVATTSYVFAREIGGDTELASGAITLSTLVSPLAFVAWVYLLRG